MRRQKARPLSSGRRASVSTSQGLRATASRRPSSAVTASCTEKPFSARQATRARRSPSSGSTTRAVRRAIGVLSKGRCGAPAGASSGSAAGQSALGTAPPSGSARTRSRKRVSRPSTRPLAFQGRGRNSTPRSGRAAAARPVLRHLRARLERDDGKAGRGGIDVERAKHRVAVGHRLRDAVEGGVPAAALPARDRLEAPEGDVHEHEVDRGHRRDAQWSRSGRPWRRPSSPRAGECARSRSG